MSWKYGGTTTAVVHLADALARAPGVSTAIASTDADGPGGRLTPATVPVCRAPFHLFPRTRSERWKWSPELFRWLWRHAGEYDVVHVHGLWSFSTTAGARAARHNRVPYLVSPHGMLSQYTWTRSPRQKQIYWRLLERRNVAGAARIHVTAAGERDEVAGLGLRVPIVTTPLGLEAAAWDVPVDAGWLRARLGGRDRGRPLVLFLSRLHPKKGVADILLPAFARLAADAFLVVAGGEDSLAPGYEAEVRRQIGALGLGDRVQLIGPVGPEDRWRAFDGAAAFVLPSHQENFGMVVAEAMARGCPVVVTDRAYSCEHVAAADAGRVVPLDVARVAAATDEMLALPPADRAALGRRGRDYARANLEWDRIAASLLAAYRACAEEARR